MRVAIVALVAFVGALVVGGLGMAPGHAAPGQGRPHVSTSGAETAPTDMSAQARLRRARTRIRVYPLYPYRTFSTPYPVPYTYEFPGPNAVRQCASWLAAEYRPSGAVIVPRMRCWWQR